MIPPDEYRKKVLNGRRHIAIAKLETDRQEHERCQQSLVKHTPDMNDARYVTKLQRCYLSEEEFLAQESVVAHYDERVSEILNDEDVEREVAVLRGQTEY